MTLKFTRYNSIENVQHAKTMAQIDLQGISKENWVVSEKVHGANFSIWMDGNEIRFAKKSGFVKEGENFYSFSRIQEDLKRKVTYLLKTVLPNANSLRICGELFGGSFKHPDVPNIDVKTIQKGILYSPDIEFMAFDIYVDDLLVNQDEFDRLAYASGLFYARVLFKGTLDECLAYPNEYNSTIPELLGYPKLTDNVCEGNVIKPTEPTFFGNESRVILKNKNEKWSEKSKERKAPKQVVKLSDAGKEKVTTLIQYVTENRLRNVLSKIGEVTQKDFGKILGLMTQDVLEDYNKDFSDLPELEKAEDKLVKKLVSQEIAGLIRPNFRNMIDNMF